MSIDASVGVGNENDAVGRVTSAKALGALAGSGPRCQAGQLWKSRLPSESARAVTQTGPVLPRWTIMPAREADTA